MTNKETCLVCDLHSSALYRGEGCPNGCGQRQARLNVEEFIEARISALADAATASGSTASHLSPNWHSIVEDDERVVVLDEHYARVAIDVGGSGRHISLNDPGHTLRLCAALRELFERARPRKECRGHPGPWMPHGEYGPGFCREPDIADSLRVIAEIWRTHPDFDPSWTVDGGGKS
ncbi:DUF6221 family protein (plasmid) [Nocardia sp. CA-151230]|uniref:DUF6221 family protein n=1 Tax=Nocardia sp. CA-151230 TaxID=3239982 RepID=UPI003D943D22